jgi:hypothetical protein
MPKYTKQQQEELISKAKRLFCKDFELETIADLLKVSITTIEKWAREHEFEKAKKSQLLALSEIRASILESYAAVLNGEKPKISADTAVKYAKAFEQLSSKKQVLMYMYEGFELLTDEYQRQVQQTRGKDAKVQKLNELKSLRENMNNVLQTLNNEILGND